MTHDELQAALDRRAAIHFAYQQDPITPYQWVSFAKAVITEYVMAELRAPELEIELATLQNRVPDLELKAYIAGQEAMRVQIQELLDILPTQPEEVPGVARVKALLQRT